MYVVVHGSYVEKQNQLNNCTAFTLLLGQKLSK